MMLLANQVLEHKTTANRWRVLELDASTGDVWLYNMDDRTAVPQKFPADLVASDDNFVEVTPPRTVTRLKPSEAALRRRDAAYAAIEPLVASAAILEPSQRSAMVLARAKAVNCSPQTIYRLLRAWWRNGQSRQALTPQFHAAGNAHKGTNGRGRPSKFGFPTYQLTAADEAHMRDILNKVFLKDELTTLEGAYQALLEKHYAYVDAEGNRMLHVAGERPSIHQFRWYARKNIPAERLLRSRKGNAEFELKHRPVLGSLRQATYTVGDVYEIDSTVADVMLVHQDDRSRIIGKPSLYLARDRKSSLIVGVYVGLEEASWPAAQQAIASITEDKEALCKRYGVAYRPEDWPAHRIMPKEFVADRGSEMLGQRSTRIADGLELIVTNLPTRRGDWKPHVEFGFKQVQRAMRGVIPGYVPPEDYGKRQRKDFASGAALTLKEFRKTVLEIVIRYNNSPMASYPLAPRYVLQDVQPTPINIWNVEVRDRAGLLPNYSDEDVRLALLPRAKATVTRHGIRLGDCLYGAREATEYGWFVAAGSGQFQVEVSYDLRCADVIYVHDDHNPNLCFEARLLDTCAHFLGMSHREVESLGILRQELNLHGEQVSRQRAADYHAAVSRTAKAAKDEARAASQGKSRSARKKDTRAAREDALRRERQESVRPTMGSAVLATPANVIPLAPVVDPPDGTAPTSRTKSRQQQYEDLMNGR